ncbi:hypothetical protein OGAPHI_004362 [Ogataea philodendri]|uniref:Uncharacterized protein n=1 Tax=Ogataea philodendri TaxID=1378263 RepID=A0A9P8P5G2_9ASCO|nr:uncharacterized protein OGAPHI_004362 [Ogataea philodendri]KAH3666173.1 hypothetical protein OGAPHI_004362 [Ogataea philodendri]
MKQNALRFEFNLEASTMAFDSEMFLERLELGICRSGLESSHVERAQMESDAVELVSDFRTGENVSNVRRIKMADLRVSNRSGGLGSTSNFSRSRVPSLVVIASIDCWNGELDLEVGRDREMLNRGILDGLISCSILSF